MTYTDAFIDYLNRFDYIDNPYKQEYTPAYLDSVEELEDEMAYECEAWSAYESEEVENIIPFPSFNWNPTDPATSALVA